MSHFDKILVANRGEIAIRVIETCRRMGISTVAVFSDADEHALHATAADEAVRLVGTSAADTYLRGDLIIEAAVAAGAEAIHPGYGFLSENAPFAAAVATAGLQFIGPPPEAIAAMGSKSESKRLMRSAGVPTVPGSEPSTADPAGLAATGKELGYPLLVKAVSGGGGKGMRIVASADGFAEAVEGAQREAASAFGDATVLVERYLEEARHIEIQIVADSHGDTVHLFERECSIQRRYQKIIEEAPSPAVDEDLRNRMGAAAVAAAKAVGYVGAGTVEFLVADDEFFFLEMNTRLQVEHPITEMVTGLDLVREQIRIAGGEPLSAATRSAEISGHAIEARLYAEDPANGFLPVAGTLERFRIQGPVRVDTGVVDGSEVSVFYDPLLAKVVSHAPTREEATAALVATLKGAEIHGLTTNRELLVRLLESEAFSVGAIDTGLLERMNVAEMSAPLATDHEANAVAATLAGQAGRRAVAPVLTTIPSGWRNAPSQLQTQVWETEQEPIAVGYRFDRIGLMIEVEGATRQVLVHGATPDQVDMSFDGVRRTYRVHRVARRVWVSSAVGHSAFVQVSRFPPPTVMTAPGSLQSPMPGKVVAIPAGEGTSVADGDPVVVIEAMKMEHTVRTPHAGTVASLEVAVGDQVAADQILAVVEPTQT